MKHNNGITLISLVIALLLVGLLASITVATSMSTYNQMKFEGAKTELEEVKKIVDEIAADYQTYLKEIRRTGAGTEYKDYFAARYNDDSFSDKLLANHEDDVENLLISHSEIEISSITTFYFTSNDLARYFGLKGIDDVVVDFATRTVYSVHGIKNPKNQDMVYYTAADWGGNTTIIQAETEEDVPVVTVTKIASHGTLHDVQLTIRPKIDNKIIEVYLYREGKYVKFDTFRDISNDVENIIRVTVEGNGQYQFLVVDELKNYYQNETNFLLE